MPTAATIPVTPGAGINLDATQVTVGTAQVVRETVVLADATDGTQYATVSGGALLVNVDNFPTTQPVSGTVAVSGTVSTSGNVVASQPTGTNLHTVVDSGSVSVSNLPATQAVSSTQLPAALDGSGNLKVAVENASIPVTGSFYQTTQPVSAAQLPTALDGSGNLKVAVQNSSLPVTGTFYQATQPVSGTVAVSGTVTTSGSATVSQATGSNLHAVLDSGSTTAVTQTTASNLNAAVVGTGVAGTPAGGVLSVQGVSSGTPLPVSGTVAVSGTVTTSGTATVSQATGSNLHTVVDSGSVTVSGTATVSQATGSNLHAVLDSGSTTAVTQATASNLNAAVVGTGTAGTPAGGVLTVQGVSGGTPQPVSATSAANSATNTLFTNIADGTSAMGAMANFGTMPSAVKAINTNSSIAVGTTAVRTNQTTTAAGVVDVNIVGSIGATNSATNGTFARITDNTTAITAAVSALGTAPTGTSVMAVNNVALPSTAAGAACSLYSGATVTTAVVAKASAGNLYGCLVNGGTSGNFLQFMNAGSSPTLGAASVFSIQIPSSGIISIPPGSFALSNFSSGISVGISTTYNGASAGTSAAVVLFYK